MKKSPRDVFESGGNLKHSVIGSPGQKLFEEGLKFSVSLFFRMCTEVLCLPLPRDSEVS